MMYMYFVLVFLQHANEDVEKMILGNKCDMEDKRQVSKERGDTVRILHLFFRAYLHKEQANAEANFSFDICTAQYDL